MKLKAAMFLMNPIKRTKIHTEVSLNEVCSIILAPIWRVFIFELVLFLHYSEMPNNRGFKINVGHVLGPSQIECTLATVHVTCMQTALRVHKNLYMVLILLCGNNLNLLIKNNHYHIVFNFQNKSPESSQP